MTDLQQAHRATTTQSSPPAIDTLKAQARRLRSELAGEGHSLTHGRSLEIVAHQHGYRDWNTLHAAAEATAPGGVGDLRIGTPVSGRYLGQEFKGTLVALRSLAGGSRFGVTIRFDEPVDVVAFESFSSFRRQVSAIVDAAGRTAEKTSNGLNHLTLDLQGFRHI